MNQFFRSTDKFTSLPQINNYLKQMTFGSIRTISTHFLSKEAGGLSNSRREEGDRPNRVPLESCLSPIYDLFESAHSSDLRRIPPSTEKDDVLDNDP